MPRATVRGMMWIAVWSRWGSLSVWGCKPARLCVRPRCFARLWVLGVRVGDLMLVSFGFRVGGLGVGLLSPLPDSPPSPPSC